MSNPLQHPKLNRPLVTALAVLLVLPFLGERVFGQRATASVAGSIADGTGATVPGAHVSVRNLFTSTERSVESNDLGYYVITALPAGPYSLTVKKPGFQTQT